MIRQSYMELTGGNACAAALLAVFENWTNTRLRHREQAEAINRQDRQANRPAAQDTGLWIFRTKTELIQEDMCGMFGRAAFDKAIELLITLKLIERRHNPEKPRDRTLQYRLDVVRLNGLLEQKRKSAFGKADIDSSKSGNQPLLVRKENQKEIPIPPVCPPKLEIGKKMVTEEEHALAAGIIAAFNQAAGTGYRSDSIDHLRPILGRVREFPELALAEHRQIIAAVFGGRRWWDDPASPRIIYGNKGQFESSIEVWRAAPTATLRVVEPQPDPGNFAADRERLVSAWPAIAGRLQRSVPENSYRLWLEPLRPLGAVGDEVLLGAPERIRGWTERRYQSLIEEALSDHPWTTVKFSTIPGDIEAAA